ncbi:MAG: Ig-like domain-containing protein [Lachnospiraceae bacterium]|nr:Ig-like domain-containing protein [Lachnospiraceae bacterium]
MKKGITILLLTLFLAGCSGILGGGQAKAAGSYMIKVNKQQNVVTIYRQENGEYKAYKAFVCSVGYATPTGTFSLGEKMRWHVLDGPSYGQYCCRIYQGFLFHSVWYYQMGQKNTQSYVQYNRLGTTASHGCVRLTVKDAKWIYDNCPSGTKIVIYNSKNPGPLGKPLAIKVNGYSGWDPTDPDPANPYHNKKPSITGAKSKNIAYGSKFKIMKGIKAKNSTGYDAKKLVETKIWYKLDKKSKYKKAKEVNTEKPGQYKVTYMLTDEIGHKAKVTVVYKVLTKVNVSAITLKNKTKTLYLGGMASAAKFTLKVKKIKPASATHKEVKYSSSNPAIATVSKKGVVKAKKAGTVTISVTATDGSGTAATCKVTVLQYATGLTLTAPGKTLDVGNAMQLRASFTPSDVSSKALTWTSSNTAVATVSASGSVRALKSGTVTITATTKDGSKISAQYTITVVYRYAKTTTSVGEKSVAAGTTWQQIITSVLPKTVTIADSQNHTAQAAVTWSCPNYGNGAEGTYTATGRVSLPSGWSGTIPAITVKITVTAGSASGPAVTVAKAYMRLEE